MNKFNTKRNGKSSGGKTPKDFRNRRRTNNFQDKVQGKESYIDDGMDFGKTGDSKEIKPEAPNTSQNGTYTFVKTTNKPTNLVPVTGKADPYDTGKPVSIFYPITNKPNKSIDVNYKGVPNLAGTIVQDITNNTSKTFPHMKYVDAARMKLVVNWGMLDYNEPSKQVRHENNKAMAESFYEAISQLEATSFLQHGALKYVRRPKTLDKQTFSSLDKRVPAMFDGLVLYQTILQNINSIPLAYNKALAYEKQLVEMAHKTGSQNINQLYAYLKKAAFSSQILNVSKLMIGEYFDKQWAKEVAVLQVGTSQHANSYTDPTLELIAVHALPEVNIGITVNPDKPLTDNNYLSVVSTDDFRVDGKYLTDLVSDFQERLSITSILKWARGLENKAHTENAKMYFNKIEKSLQDIVLAVRGFESAFSGLRTVLEVLNNTGFLYWVNNHAPAVLEPTNTYADPVRNKLVEHIFRAQVGDNKLTYSTDTLRFKYNTIWDKFDGIPTFDTKSGGITILASIKDINLLDADGANKLVPRLFSLGSVEDRRCHVVNRLGEEYIIGFEKLEIVDSQENWLFKRINPYNKVSHIIVPSLNVSNLSQGAKQTATYMMDFFHTVFGVGKIKWGTGANDVQHIMRSSYLSFIDIEIPSFATDMQSYYRAYSPFKIMNLGQPISIGFDLGGNYVTASK